MQINAAHCRVRIQWTHQCAARCSNLQITDGLLVIFDHAVPRDGKMAEASYATAPAATQAVIQALAEGWTVACFAVVDGSAGLDFACFRACVPHFVVAEELVPVVVAEERVPGLEASAASRESLVSHSVNQDDFPRTVSAGSAPGVAPGAVLAEADSVLGA